MNKRIICFLLAAIMILGMCAVCIPQASAAGNMKTSEKGIALIKELEGFAWNGENE